MVETYQCQLIVFLLRMYLRKKNFKKKLYFFSIYHSFLSNCSSQDGAITVAHKEKLWQWSYLKLAMTQLQFTVEKT